MRLGGRVCPSNKEAGETRWWSTRRVDEVGSLDGASQVLRDVGVQRRQAPSSKVHEFQAARIGSTNLVLRQRKYGTYDATLDIGPC